MIDRKKIERLQSEGKPFGDMDMIERGEFLTKLPVMLRLVGVTKWPEGDDFNRILNEIEEVIMTSFRSMNEGEFNYAFKLFMSGFIKIENADHHFGEPNIRFIGCVLNEYLKQKRALPPDGSKYREPEPSFEESIIRRTKAVIEFIHELKNNRFEMKEPSVLFMDYFDTLKTIGIIGNDEFIEEEKILLHERVRRYVLKQADEIKGSSIIRKNFISDHGLNLEKKNRLYNNTAKIIAFAYFIEKQLFESEDPEQWTKEFIHKIEMKANESIERNRLQTKSN